MNKRSFIPRLWLFPMMLIGLTLGLQLGVNQKSVNQRYYSVLRRIVALCSILSWIVVSSCSPTKERRIENRYSSATWSPDGTQVTYFKTHIEYVSVKPRFSLFIGEDTKTEVIEKVQVFLCVNDAEGMSERILDEIELPDDQQDLGVYTNIEWVDDYIRYGVGVQGGFSTGVLQTTPEGDEKQLVESGYKSMVALQPRTVNANNQELYSGFGDYGFFGHRIIYIFDHEMRQTRVYLHDPLSNEAPFIPPYTVTQK